MTVYRLFLVTALFASVLVLPGCPCGEEVTAELAPFSGRFGYGVTGPWGFQGALTKEYPGDAEWLLEGTFQFPTPGYTVLGPEIQVMESFPEQVFIRINVLTPAPGTILPQVITEAPFSRTVPASDQATFEIVFTPRCL